MDDQEISFIPMGTRPYQEIDENDSKKQYHQMLPSDQQKVIENVYLPQKNEETPLVDNKNMIFQRTLVYLKIKSIISAIIIAISIVIIIYFLYSEYFPVTDKIKSANCIVNDCSYHEIICCSGKENSRNCFSKNAAILTYTLKLDGIDLFTKNETYYCDGPSDNYDWAYDYMCSDPILTKITCYYDDRNIYQTLHLSKAFFEKPLKAIYGIISASTLIFIIIIFELIVNIKYCRKPK